MPPAMGSSQPVNRPNVHGAGMFSGKAPNTNPFSQQVPCTDHTMILFSKEAMDPIPEDQSGRYEAHAGGRPVAFGNAIEPQALPHRAIASCQQTVSKGA